jgi:hypothetical protein
MKLSILFLLPITILSGVQANLIPGSGDTAVVRPADGWSDFWSDGWSEWFSDKYAKLAFWKHPHRIEMQSCMSKCENKCRMDWKFNIPRKDYTREYFMPLFAECWEGCHEYCREDIGEPYKGYWDEKVGRT